jgi:hypothetical protein
MTIANPTPDNIEFVSAAGKRVSVPMSEWQAHLQEHYGVPVGWFCELGTFSIEFFGGEILFVFAPHDNMTAPFRLEIAFLRGEDTLMMGFGVPDCPVPDNDSEHVLYQCADLGHQLDRKWLEVLLAQPVVRSLIIDDWGIPVREVRLAPELLARIRAAMDEGRNARPLRQTLVEGAVFDECTLAYLQLAHEFDAMARSPAPSAAGCDLRTA